jgi:hypothetical protein
VLENNGALTLIVGENSTLRTSDSELAPLAVSYRLCPEINDAVG